MFKLRMKVIAKNSCEKSLLKVVGFLRVLRFPPTGKVDRVGYDKHS